MTARPPDEAPPAGELVSPDGRALFVDYGGVLTPGVAEGWRRFEEQHGMEARTVSELLWAAYEQGAEDSAVARVERGELEVAAFEQELAGALRERGHDVAAEGLVRRLFADLRPAGGVWELVHDVRVAGVPAVMVSNSWGFTGYPEPLLRVTFDELVISGRLGVRKPDREIFEHAAAAVEAELSRCVLVDDGRANVEAARSYGMVGVLHTGDDAATREAVTAALAFG